MPKEVISDRLPPNIRAEFVARGWSPTGATRSVGDLIFWLNAAGAGLAFDYKANGGAGAYVELRFRGPPNP